MPAALRYAAMVSPTTAPDVMAVRIPWVPLGMLVTLWAGFWFVSPIGDIPFVDDWVFAESTRTLVQTGSWRPHDFSSMPMITNAVWAAPVCALTACSYSDLRITTMVAASLLMMAAYGLARDAGGGRYVAALGAGIVAFNPVIFALSITFMTEVLFLALLCLSLLFFQRALRSGDPRAIAAATLLALLATLSRQFGLSVPLAFCVVRFLAKPAGGLRYHAVSVAPLAVCASALLAFNAMLEATDAVPSYYSFAARQLFAAFERPYGFVLVYSNSVATLLLLGVFLLPLLLLVGREAFRHAGRGFEPLAVLAALPVLILAVLYLALARVPMPLLGGSWLAPHGVGPAMLRSSVIGDRAISPLPDAFWYSVTVLGLTGAFLLSALVTRVFAGAVRYWRDMSLEMQRSLLSGLAGGIFIAPTLFSGANLDRYTIAAMPLLLPLILSNVSMVQRRLVLAAAMAMFVCMAAFAVLGTRDYVARSNARWAAIDHAERRLQLDYRVLDGGFEYNGIRNFFEYSARTEDGLWWYAVEEKEYVIAFDPIVGSEIVARFPYRTLMPPTERFIFLLRQNPSGE